MGFYDDRDSVEQYMKMSEGFDGRFLIDRLGCHIEEGAGVLELGMGPGRDLDILRERYRATGSDKSEEFLKRYRARRTDADLLLIDAAVIDTGRTFDAVYSNKVLIHLPPGQLRQSFAGQYEICGKGGIILHSFWYGRDVEDFDGLRFYQYELENLTRAAGPMWELIEAERYGEFDDNDSIYIIMRKKSP